MIPEGAVEENVRMEISDEAVEAAARVLGYDPDWDSNEIDRAENQWFLSRARQMLEAAAPHMLAGPEASIRAALAYGADREKYTDTGDPKVDAAIKSYAYHVRRVMSEAYEATK